MCAKLESKKVADRHVIRLYKAVANYIEHVGGLVVVTGGIQIQQWPGDGEHRFIVAIKCTGNKPRFATGIKNESTLRNRK